MFVAVIGLSFSVPARDLSEFKTADELWLYITKMQQEGPGEHASTVEQHRAIVKEFLGEIDTALVEFGRRFPADPRRWDAKLSRIQVAGLQASLDGRAYDMAGDETVLKEVAAASDASTESKSEASATLVQIHAAPLLQSSNVSSARVAAVEAEINAFEKQFPDNDQKDGLELIRAHLYQKTDPAKAETLMAVLAKSANPEIADQAQGYIVTSQLARKPLDLKFTAVDGSTVDVTRLRGKVVMLDFWATWCGPCVMSMPNVIGTYKKLHEKGFEIVGISLDRDKDKLLKFTKDREMTWPQYFDGKAWESDIGTRFHIHAIPATWLVDKKGFARPLEEGSDLSAQIERLLAE